MPPTLHCLCTCTAQVDLVDLGEGRDPRFRYVLVVVELYTRFIWIYPLPTKHALLVARHVSADQAACPSTWAARLLCCV